MNIGPFENLRQLLGCYRYMKADLSGSKAVLPRPDQNSTDNYQIFARRSTMEEKLSFIADVEGFCDWYCETKRIEGCKSVRKIRYSDIPLDAVREIFVHHFAQLPSCALKRENPSACSICSRHNTKRCVDIGRKSFIWLALKFQKRISKGERLPRILKDRSNLRRFAIHLNDYMGKYFVTKSYIK